MIPTSSHAAYTSPIYAYEDNPQPNDVLVRGSDGRWLSVPPNTLPVGSQGQTMVAGGNLGSATAFHLLTRDMILVGTLNNNCVITVDGMAPGSHFRLLLTQDATGGWTPTLSDGTNSLDLIVDPTALVSSFVDCWSPNGVDIIVIEG